MIDVPARQGILDCRELLTQRVREPAPGRIQLVSGPRQVGKTTLVLELAESLGPRALYAAGDGPEAMLPGFWERIWTRAEQLAKTQGPAVVFLDEIQHVPDWAGRLKGEWDRLRRRRLPVHVVVTGSSALLLADGSRESLAGRFERLTIAHWSARAVAEAFGISAGDALTHVLEMGCYPGAFPFRGDVPRWTAYVRDSIVEPAIGRDILALAPVRRPALLRQVFALAASSPAQIVSLQKLQGQLQDAGALDTIAHYLGLLEEAYLVAGLEKYSEQAARRRAAPPKLVTLNQALLRVLDPRGAPQRERDPTRFGAWVENACLAHAWNAGQSVRYWREEPLEVDAVLEGSWGAFAIEVKTGAFDSHELRGLLEFARRHPRFRPLVLCDAARREAAERAGVEAMPWQAFMMGAPGMSETQDTATRSWVDAGEETASASTPGDSPERPRPRRKKSPSASAEASGKSARLPPAKSSKPKSATARKHAPKRTKGSSSKSRSRST